MTHAEHDEQDQDQGAQYERALETLDALRVSVDAMWHVTTSVGARLELSDVRRDLLSARNQLWRVVETIAAEKGRKAAERP